MLNNKPVVSVVIPVYNAIEYLPACLGSVVNQTLGADKLEVIVVDDGSTDGSAAYLQEFAKDRPYIRLICLPHNTGCPGRVRNIGIEAATGEWLYCVDADDWLGPEALERLVRHAEEWGSDVIQGRMRNINWENDTGTTAYFSGIKDSIPKGDLEKNGVLTSSLSPMRLIKMSLLREQGIWFPEDCWYEDVIFMLRVLFSANHISIANDYEYYFARRDEGRSGGISETTTVIPLKRPEKLAEGINNIFDIIDKYSENPSAYLKIIKKIFTSQIHDAFVQIDTGAKCFPEKYPENGQKIKRRLWERVCKYYTPELKAILSIEDVVRYDYIQSGIYKDFEMSILHFCNPLPVNTVEMIGNEADRINIKKENILSEVLTLAEDTRERLYRSSLSSAIFCVNEVIFDHNSKLVIKGDYQYPLMITEEPEITPVLEYKGKLSIPESVRVQKSFWGEPYQGCGTWESVFLYEELLQNQTTPVHIYLCFKYDRGEVVAINTFRANRFAERILTVDIPALTTGDQSKSILVELGNVFRNESVDDQLANVTQNLDNVNRKLENTKSKLENIKSELENTKSKLENTKSKLENTKSKLKSVNCKLEQLQYKNEEMNSELVKTKKELGEIRNSKSWRLTKPLRALSVYIRDLYNS